MKVALGLTADGAWLPIRLGQLNVRNGCRLCKNRRAVSCWIFGAYDPLRTPSGRSLAPKSPYFSSAAISRRTPADRSPRLRITRYSGE